MATLRDIRRRIQSVTNTQQITTAMKMIAAARLNRAQNEVKAAQPFSQKLLEMVQSLSSRTDEHPFLHDHGQGALAVILFTSDRGLCAGFNTKLIQLVERELQGDKENLRLFAFGRVGADFFRRHGWNIEQKHTHLTPAKKLELLEGLAKNLGEAFVQKKVSKVLLAYNHFKNPLTQEPLLTPLLPLPKDTNSQEAEEGKEGEMIFEPNLKDVFNNLLPRYVKNRLLAAHLNTEAGEHGARMVAMEGASKNANEMITSLTLQYNRLRQAAITKELIEIVNGAESL